MSVRLEKQSVWKKYPTILVIDWASQRVLDIVKGDTSRGSTKEFLNPKPLHFDLLGLDDKARNVSASSFA